MSRRCRDIPIRPRYGYAEEATGEEAAEARSCEMAAMVEDGTNDGDTTGSHIASSYSEIVFRLPVADAKEQLECDVTLLQEQRLATTRTATNTIQRTGNAADKDATTVALGTATDQPPMPPLRRPDSLYYTDSSVPYELEGTVRQDGRMLHFVADNIERTLKTASPGAKKDPNALTSRNSTPSTSATAIIGSHTAPLLPFTVPKIDANAVADIESEAQYLAAAVDNLTENLYNLLHSISSIAADNVDVHRSAVNKLTDSMDANIKCMYTIMAKTEEITKSMKPSEQLGQRIREVKRLVDMLDSTI